MNLLKSTSDKQESSILSKQYETLETIISVLSKSDHPLTITEIAETIKTSVPTCTKLMSELVGRELVIESGKRKQNNGRRPTVYTLNKENFYTVGVEILEKWIHFSVVDIDLSTVYESKDRSFALSDNQECLNTILLFIKQGIKESGIRSSQIIGVGIAMAGHVNPTLDEPDVYFRNLTKPMRTYLEEELGLPVMIDNDTRVRSSVERAMGKAQGAKNAIIVRYNRDLGVSVVVEDVLVLGNEGLAGNLNHMAFGTKKRLCKCGKTNCLSTEVSGEALLTDLKERLLKGEKSLCFSNENIEHYKYHDVLDAGLEGDLLSIKILSEQGYKLGQAIGNIINLLNPQIVIIGGEIVMVKHIFLPALQLGLQETALPRLLNECVVEASGLGRYFSSRAAACMVLGKYHLINY